MNDHLNNDQLLSPIAEYSPQVRPSRNSVMINTSTNSYLGEVFDTFGEDHLPAQPVQAVTIVNEYQRYEDIQQGELLKPKGVFCDSLSPPKTQRKKHDQVSSKSPNPPSQMSTNKQREIIRAIKQKNSALRMKKQDLLKAAISTLDDEEEEDIYRHHSRSPQS